MIDIKNFGKGGKIQPKDRRDFRFELVAGEPELPKEYSLRSAVRKIKNQNSSLSCVGQAFSYYTEVLNYLETKEYTELSARDIYSLIFIKNGGGAYIRDGAKKVINSGVVLEQDAPSYENGQPPSELFMENRNDITAEEQENGMKYKAKSFTTWKNTNFDTYKKAIYTGNGCVAIVWGNDTIWRNVPVSLPDNKSQTNWLHCVYFCGWAWKNGIECLEFANSWSYLWGDKGFNYLPRSYIEKGYVVSPITLVDVPNNTFPKIKSQIMNITEQVNILQKLVNLFIQWLKK